MAAALDGVRQVLTQSDRVIRRSGEWTTLCRLGWAGIVVMLVAIVLDVVVQLPDAVRAGITALAIIGIAFGITLIVRNRKQHLSPDRLARIIENKSASLDNALINAVQFERAMDRESQPLGRELMQREMMRAEAAASQIPPRMAVDHAQLVREKKRLAAATILAIIVIAALPGLFLAVVPRFLDPFGDHPPFSFTRFVVEPAGMTVHYGDSLPIRVRTEGQRPRSLSLVMSADGKTWNSLPLFQESSRQYVQKIENIRSDAVYYVQSENGRSHRYRLSVLTAPRVQSILVTYRYPDYTNQKSVTERLSGNGIRGVSGTEVHLELKTNRPLQDGRLRLSLQNERGIHTSPVQADKSDSQKAGADFTIRRSGDFTVDLVGKDGLETRSAASGRIVLQRDDRPLVFIREPSGNAFATPDVRVPVVIDAEDSFGLRSVQLHRSMNESRDIPLSHNMPEQPRKTSVKVDLDMADLGVRPGDTITYFATAYDTDPRRRNSSDTDVFSLRIISREQYEQMMRSQTSANELSDKYKDIIKEMKRLADEQTRIAQQTQQLAKRLKENPTANDLKKAADLSQQQQSISRQTNALAKMMDRVAQEKPLFDIERDANRQVAQWAKQFAQAASAMSSAAKDLTGGGTANQAMKSQQEALRKMGQPIRQSDSLDKALKEMQKVYPVYEDLAKFLALVEAQSNLVLKAKEFEGVRSPTAEQKARMEELAEHQGKIRDALSDTMADLRKHADRVQKDHPELAQKAKAFCEKVEGMPIQEKMSGAQTEFESHRGKPGHDNAQAASDMLKSLMKESKSGQGQCQSDCLSFCLSQGIDPGDTLAQLATGFGLGMGMGRGNGSGFGFGSGMGLDGQSGQSGMGGSGFTMGGATGEESSMQIYGPQSPSGTRTRPGERTNRPRKKGIAPDEKGNLSAAHVEVLRPGHGNLPDAPGLDQDRSPAEYKPLIREYFRRVSEDSHGK